MESTKKSVGIQEVKEPLLSVQAAACHSLTLPEVLKSGQYSAEELLQVGLVIFNRLCREMMSGDAMYLAFSAAKEDLKRTTLDPDKVDYMVLKYAELADKARKSNPMTSMFF